MDLSGIKTVRGDYDQNQLSEKYDNEVLFTSVINNWERQAKGLKTLIFSASVKNSVAMCSHFKQLGYNAKHIDSENTSEIERNSTLEWFDKTDNAILCNVGIATGSFNTRIESIAAFRTSFSSSFRAKSYRCCNASIVLFLSSDFI